MVVILILCANIALGWTTRMVMEDRLRAISINELNSARALVLSVMTMPQQDPANPNHNAMGTFDKWFDTRNKEYPGKLWSVLGPKTAAFVATKDRAEPSRLPRDDIDIEAIRTGKPVGRFVGDTYRYSVPVVLGITSGTDQKLCTTCHSKLMGINNGEVIGVFSSSLRAGAAAHQIWYMVAAISCILLLVAGALLLLLRTIFGNVVTKPVHEITETMGRLTNGELDVSIPCAGRADEVGDIAKAVKVFKRNLIRNRELVRQIEEANKKLELSGTELRSALVAANAASQAKSQFLATMSHELRTPLNAIIGFSEIQKEQLFGPIGNETYRRYSEDIFNSGRHLLQLINDILDFAKSDAHQLKLNDDTVDLNGTVEACTRYVETQAERAKVGISAALEKRLPLLRADERRVRQIVINLLSNAVKFTPEGGKVTISTECRHGGLAVTIADTGIGIAPEDIPVVLMRFGQVDNSHSRQHEGTGLGLPLAKQLTEAHGGTLTIESAVGNGTKVTVRFPPERVLVRDTAIFSNG